MNTESSSETKANSESVDWVQQQLVKYATRNKTFIESINRGDTFEWVVNKMKGGMSGSREEMGNEKANASLSLMASYNTLTLILLPMDNLDKEKTKQFLDRIAEQKTILTKS